MSKKYRYLKMYLELGAPEPTPSIEELEAKYVQEGLLEYIERVYERDWTVDHKNRCAYKYRTVTYRDEKEDGFARGFTEERVKEYSKGSYSSIEQNALNYFKQKAVEDYVKMEERRGYSLTHYKEACENGIEVLNDLIKTSKKRGKWTSTMISNFREVNDLLPEDLKFAEDFSLKRSLDD